MPLAVREGIHSPLLITRERIATSSMLREGLTNFGFGTMARIEQPQDVLIATLDGDDNILAAGMLVKSHHLMMSTSSHNPEIHVHAGEKQVVRDMGNGEQDITWKVTPEVLDAATLTLQALITTAHARDVWNLKKPVVGVPLSYAADSPLWATSSLLRIDASTGRVTL